MKFKHLLVVIATLVLILAGCSSGGNDKKTIKSHLAQIVNKNYVFLQQQV